MTRDSHTPQANGSLGLPFGRRAPFLALRIALVPTLASIAGCATVDSRSAAPAFADAAHGARDSFDALDRAEADAFLTEALSQPAADVRISPSRECLVEDTASVVAAGRCRARIVVRGQPADVSAAGPSLLMAADGLTSYADSMAAAAAARDIDARHSALRSLAASAGSLGAIAGVPGLAAMGNLLADAERAKEVARRRRALARIAEAVDPAIQGIATIMAVRAGKLRENVALARGQSVVEAQSAYASAGAGPGRRGAALGVLDATARLRDAADAPVDFSSLVRAHRALIASLSRPHEDVSDALRTIGIFAGDAQGLRRALGERR